MSDKLLAGLDPHTVILDADLSYIETAGAPKKAAQSDKKAYFLTAPAFTGLTKRSVTTGITASATSIQGGSPLTTDINQVSTCATTGDSVTLPTAIAGLSVTIINNGANAADVFPASGDDCGAGVDLAVSLAAGVNITYLCLNDTTWFVQT